MRKCFGGDAFLFLAMVEDDDEDVAGKRSTGVLFSLNYAVCVVHHHVRLLCCGTLQLGYIARSLLVCVSELLLLFLF